MVSALRPILPGVASCDLLFCMTGFHLLYTPLHPSVRTPELKITFFGKARLQATPELVLRLCASHVETCVVLVR